MYEANVLEIPVKIFVFYIATAHLYGSTLSKRVCQDTEFYTATLELVQFMI